MTRILKIIVLLFPALLFSQESVPSGNAFSVSSKVESFWSMFQLSGGIGYIIMAVLALGLFLIFLKAIEFFLDKRHSRAWRKTSFKNMDLQKIQSLSSAHPNSIIGRTIAHIMDFYRSGGHPNNIHQELVMYMEQEQERFETFRNWLHFLSDSAGALGLLGTVWGVFLTFFGGSLDSEKILAGMGVALITTLLGLVVSLIINLFHTQIYSAFQRRIEWVTQKTDELRLQILNLDNKKELSFSRMQTQNPTG